MTHFLLVMVGGALGAASRYGMNQLMPKSSWSTTVVNIVGSFLAVWLFFSFFQENTNRHLYVVTITGFLGAFTTFSAFSLDTMQMLKEKSSLSQLALFVGLNVAGSLLAAYIAMKIFYKEH